MLRFLFNYRDILGTLNQHEFHCMSTAHTYDNIHLIFSSYVGYVRFSMEVCDFYTRQFLQLGDRSNTNNLGSVLTQSLSLQTSTFHCAFFLQNVSPTIKLLVILVGQIKSNS